ncbi:prolyl 4-hydroxylase subunit alpha-3-like [Penaeus indicus]|uniref:prolyl 4-hydroxylase subunit alpha-3-like n=1 Tax=Penaeus indicus TaxID=29960 RepID=UPI00300D3E0E
MVLDAMGVGGDVLNEAILGNPLHVYALIKRMVLYWPRVKDIVYNTTKAKEICHDKIQRCDEWINERGCDAKHVDKICPYSCGFCQVNESNPALKAAENRTVLPSRLDLIGAAQSLALLQRVYLLPMKHLLNGRILDTDSSVTYTKNQSRSYMQYSYSFLTAIYRPGLTTWDILRVARASADAGRWVNAWVWYDEAHSAIPDPDAQDHVADLLEFIEHQHDLDWRKDIGWRDDNQFLFLLSDVPRQEPETCVYSDLCRGDKSKLRKQIPSGAPQCHISSRGSPFLVLQPVKWEYLSHNPEIMIFPNFLSNEEVRIIIYLSRDHMMKDLGSGGRQSHHIFLANSTHPLITRLTRRIEAVTGLLAHEGANGKEDAGDPLKAQKLTHVAVDIFEKVRNYGTGGHLNPHVDVFAKHVNSTCDGNPKCSSSGDRIATFMLYLNDVKAGGSTAFYSSDVVVTPTKGMGVFWYNLKRNGLYDRRVDHGGCPVLLGSKWGNRREVDPFTWNFTFYLSLSVFEMYGKYTFVQELAIFMLCYTYINYILQKVTNSYSENVLHITTPLLSTAAAKETDAKLLVVLLVIQTISTEIRLLNVI